MCSSFSIVQRISRRGRKLLPSDFLPVSFIQSLTPAVTPFTELGGMQERNRLYGSVRRTRFKKDHKASLDKRVCPRALHGLFKVLRTFPYNLFPFCLLKHAAKRLPQSIFSKRNRRSTRRHLKCPRREVFALLTKRELHSVTYAYGFENFLYRASRL